MRLHFSKFVLLGPLYIEDTYIVLKNSKNYHAHNKMFCI